MGLIEKFRTVLAGPKPVTGGVLGVFDTPEEILKAAEQVKQSKYNEFDCYTPFPVHGLDDAMGLRRSRLPWVTLICGLIGGTAGFTMQYWSHAILWPINYAGKPLFAWPAYVPITFETTVLFAAHLTVAAFWILNRFPNGKPKILHPRLTHDKYGVYISQTSNHYEEDEVVQFIKSIGAKEVNIIK